jgi:hypothetical protein
VRSNAIQIWKISAVDDRQSKNPSTAKALTIFDQFRHGLIHTDFLLLRDAVGEVVSAQLPQAFSIDTIPFSTDLPRRRSLRWAISCAGDALRDDIVPRFRSESALHNSDSRIANAFIEISRSLLRHACLWTHESRRTNS